MLHTPAPPPERFTGGGVSSVSSDSTHEGPAASPATGHAGPSQPADSCLRAYLDASGAGLLFHTCAGRLGFRTLPEGVMRVQPAPGGVQLLAVARLPPAARLSPAGRVQLAALLVRSVHAWHAPGQPGWGAVQVAGRSRFETVEQLQAAVRDLAAGRAAPRPAEVSAARGAAPPLAPAQRGRRHKRAQAQPDVERRASPAESSGSCGGGGGARCPRLPAAEGLAHTASCPAQGGGSPRSGGTSAGAPAGPTAPPAPAPSPGEDTADSSWAASAKRACRGLSPYQAAPPAFGCMAAPAPATALPASSSAAAARCAGRAAPSPAAALGQALAARMAHPCL